MRNWLILSLCFCLSSVCNSFSWAENTEQKIKIGAIVPLTGQLAVMMQHVRNGIELAKDDLPEDIKKRVEIFYEDDGFQNTRTLSAFQNLVEFKNVSMVLSVGSGAGNTVAPIAEQKQIPMINIGGSDFNVVKNKKFSFMHWVTPETEAQALVNEIAKRGYKRVAVVGAEHSGTRALYDAMMNCLTKDKAQNKIVSTDWVQAQDTDFGPIIAKLRAKKPDGVFVLLFGTPLATFTQKAIQQGIKTDFFGIETFEDDSVVSAAKETLEGSWYINGSEGKQSFIEKYQARYGQYPGWAAANAYDSLILLVQAYDQSSGNSDKIVNHLSHIKDYDGMAGIYSATGDQRFTLPAVVKIIQNGKFKLNPQ